MTVIGKCCLIQNAFNNFSRICAFSTVRSMSSIPEKISDPTNSYKKKHFTSSVSTKSTEVISKHHLRPKNKCISKSTNKNINHTNLENKTIAVPECPSFVSSLPVIKPFKFRNHLTADITAWLFNNVKNLGFNQKYVEVEFRLGFFNPPISSTDIKGPFLSTKSTTQNTKFKVGVSPGLKNTVNLSIQNIIDTNTGKFKGKNEKSIEINYFTIKNKDIRQITSDGTSCPLEIKKKHNFLYINLPDSKYSLKLAVATEIPLSDFEYITSEDLKNPKVQYKRSMQKTFWEFDDFEICTAKSPKSKFIEVELELNREKLLNMVTKCNDKTLDISETTNTWLEFEEYVYKSTVAALKIPGIHSSVLD